MISHGRFPTRGSAGISLGSAAGQSQHTADQSLHNVTEAGAAGSAGHQAGGHHPPRHCRRGPPHQPRPPPHRPLQEAGQD